MSILLQTDTKGWIPHFVVNVFAARAPKNWQQSLYSYYMDVYSKQKQQSQAEQSGAAAAAAATGEGPPTEEKPSGEQAEGVELLALAQWRYMHIVT